MMARTIFALCCCVFLTYSCNRNGAGMATNAPSKTETQQSRRKVNINIDSPSYYAKYPLGSAIPLSVKVKNTAEPFDSLRWIIDGKFYKATSTGQTSWSTAGQTTGTHRIEAIAHYPDGQKDVVSTSIILLADKEPIQYSYKIVKTYPHDKTAYTQGLLFDDGFLYESTGLNGESTLRKVDISTGKPVQMIDMPESIFGEGLAAVGDSLIQLTYLSQVATVYRKSDFKILNRIKYPMKEGWGLTFDRRHLLMTDGSAFVYFLDKKTLAEIYRIEVCDNQVPVPLLNELEYINGELWANIYQKDEIVRINPKTGAVIGRINMDGLLAPNDLHPAIDVLNGIAYDPKTNKIYVTGKKWPKLFEIQVIRK